MSKIFAILGALLLLGVSFSAHSANVTLIKNKYVNEVAVAAMSYSSVLLACGDRLGSDQLKLRLLKLLTLADKKSSLTSDGRETLRETDHMISMGAGIYKANPYVSCSSGRSYKSQIIENADQLLRVN